MLLQRCLTTRLNFGLLLLLLRFAHVEQEALLLLAKALRKLPECRLPDPQRTQAFALLQPKGAVLSTQRPQPFAEAAHKLLTLKTKGPGLLRPLQTQRGLTLSKLTRLTCELARQLLAGEACLAGRLRNLRPRLCSLQAKLAALKGPLLSQLCRVHPKLAALQSRRLGQAGTLQAHLARAENPGLCQLLDGEPGLRRQLFRGQSKLTLLLGGLRRQLFCRKPKLTRRLRGRKSSLRALSPKRPGKLGGLLRSALLRFKRCLRPLGRRLKAGLPHLRRGPSLLFQDVPSQFLLCNRLPRTAESPCPDRLRSNTLLRDLALTGDVRQRLLDCGVLILVHEPAGRRRVKRGRRAGQSRNTLLGGRRAKGTSLLKSLCRL